MRARVYKRLPNQALSVDGPEGSQGQDQSLIIEVSGTNNSPEISPPKRAPRSIDKSKTASDQYREQITTTASAETLSQNFSPVVVTEPTVNESRAKVASTKNNGLTKKGKTVYKLFIES